MTTLTAPFSRILLLVSVAAEAAGISFANLTTWLLAIPAFLTALIMFRSLRRKTKLEIEKLERELQSQERDLTRIASRIVDIHNFCYDSVEHTYELIQSKTIVNRTYNLRVLHGSVVSLDYSLWLTGTPLVHCEQEISSTTPGLSVSMRPIHSNGTIRYCIDFDPPVVDKAEYTVKEVINDAVLTPAEIREKIRSGNWPTDEPCEMHTCLIRYKTALLRLIAIFPSHYLWAPGEHWDVMVGYTGRRATLEYQEVENGQRVEVKESNDQNKHRIAVVYREPKPGLAYWIKWLPIDTREEVVRSITRSRNNVSTH